jgi:hypothetical protein
MTHRGSQGHFASRLCACARASVISSTVVTPMNPCEFGEGRAGQGSWALIKQGNGEGCRAVLPALPVLPCASRLALQVAA